MDDMVIEQHSTKLDHGNRIANEGYVFQCQACGKKSRDMYGNEPISYGWDESCVLNSALVKEPK